MGARISAALAVAVALSATTLSAQNTAQIDLNTVQSHTVVSDTRTGAGQGINNPFYLKTPGAGGPLASYVNLWFNRNAGGLTGCSGTMLSARKILTAAHCVSNGTAIQSTGFTARFRVGTGNTAADWIDVTGSASGYAVKTGYNGAVINENDVAVITLDSDAPTWATAKQLSNGPFLTKSTIGAYGRYGVIGGAADTQSDQFSNSAVARTGFNLFETTCNSLSQCANANHSNFAGFGGVLLADADLAGVSSAGFMCTTLLFCNSGYGNGTSTFEEVGTNRGDSGSAAFDAAGNIVGVTSWGSIIDPGSKIPTGGNIGFACVAFSTINAACNSNALFIQSQVVPEPSTYALMGFGLLAMAGVARRRRAL